MTASEYRSIIKTIGLSQLAAGRWLNVSPKTAQNYASKGPSGPAAVAIRMAVGVKELQRFDLDWVDENMLEDVNGEYVRHDKLSAVVGLDPPA